MPKMLNAGEIVVQDGLCSFFIKFLRDGSKSDEFSEIFQTAFNPPPLIFGKLCCNFFMADMVAYMQGGMMTRQYQMRAHDFQRGANCRLEPFRKFIQFGSVTHPLDWYDY